MDSVNLESLAQYVEETRRRKKISLEKLRDRGGPSIGWLSSLKSGARVDTPKVDTLRKLAKGLGEPLADVLRAAGMSHLIQEEAIVDVSDVEQVLALARTKANLAKGKKVRLLELWDKAEDPREVESLEKELERAELEHTLAEMRIEDIEKKRLAFDAMSDRAFLDEIRRIKDEYQLEALLTVPPGLEKIPGLTTAAQLPSPKPKSKRSAPQGMTPLAEYLLAKKGEYTGIGFREFARILHLDEHFLADILSGLLPPEKTLRKMALYLGEEPEVLLELGKPVPRAKLTLKDALQELLVNRIELPYYGQVGCGRLFELGEHPEGKREVPAYLLEGEDLDLISLVEATGDSMMNAKIWPGVTLIVRKQDRAKDGDVVIANIPHVGTTCKRLKVKRDGKWLVSESPTPYTPIKVEDGVRIVGKVLHVWYEQSFI